MSIGETVKKAAIDNKISGVVALAKHCGLHYRRTARVWHDEPGAKIGDVETVLNSLGLKLEVVEK